MATPRSAPTPASRSVVFAVNGQLHTVDNPDPTQLLVDYLRSVDVNLTGTKVGCGEGGCGACTVTLTRWDPQTGAQRSVPANACLRPVALMDGQAVTTTEGIGNVRDGLHPIQYAIAAENGSQCGFCTPGFVMNLFAGVQEGRTLTAREIEERFDGHICRCTGFRPILQAMRGFASDAAEHQSFRSNHCCTPTAQEGIRPASTPATAVFPEALKARVRARPPLRFEGRGYRWVRPVDLAGVQAVLRRHTGDRSRVKLVGGNTEIGIYKVDVNNPRVLVDISQIPALHGVSSTPEGLRIGATATLQELLEHLQTLPAGPGQEGLRDLERHLEVVANLQVRSVGTVGGNLMMTLLAAPTTAPFPSDLLLCFSALGGHATFASGQYPGGQQRFPIDALPSAEALPDDAVLVQVDLPWGSPGEHVRSYKVRLRNEDSHPIVNAAFRVALDKAQRVQAAWLYLGGLNRLPVRLRAVEAALLGQPWAESTLQATLPVLDQEVRANTMPYPDTGFMPPGYRESLCTTLYYKYFVHVAESVGVPVSAQVASAGRLERRPLTRGAQITDVYPRTAPVGMPILKEGVFLQATGEARYTFDLQLPAGGLYAAYVLSSIARGRFSWRGGSPQAALAELQRRLPGLVDLVTVEDVPVLPASALPAGVDPQTRPNNRIGMGGDDPVFAQDGQILSWGQPIALVLAKDDWTAQTAARLAQRLLRYLRQRPVLTIPEARRRRLVFKDLPTLNHIPQITRTGSNRAWLRAPTGPMAPGERWLAGAQSSEAQAQFYMETQNCLAVPDEDRTMTIYSSTQQPAAVQQYAASILGFRNSDVTVTVRRLGGGFGGKQFRPYMLSSAAAVAAWKTRRPVKLALTRNQDMATIGKRHPYTTEFAASYTPEGRITGMRLDFYSNGGCSYDASFPVMDLSQQNGDSCYFIPTFRTTGTVLRTNLASNTAMRSFGTVQAVLGLEEAIERVAHDLGMLPEDVRALNLYKDSHHQAVQSTHFGQPLVQCHVQRIFQELRAHCAFDRRAQAVREFNAQNRWKKRGISLIPFKYGVGYQPRSMEQGSAYVSIYQADGTVLVQHGGIEVGQGINTKMAQIAAQELGIPLELVRIGDTWTGAAANSVPTAASSGSDLFGSAVQLACRVLRERLLALCDQHPEHPSDEHPDVPSWLGGTAKDWRAVVSAAYTARVDLQAEATYKEPFVDNIGGGKGGQYGRAFLYFTCSAACTEVEVDVLTGETTLLRADLLMDNGHSLNPCIDVGQIEGGYIQGVGLMLTEQMMFTPEGALYSDGTWDYKPPGTKSVPLEMNVRLHQLDRVNPVTGESLDTASVSGSRGIGEPPLVLAVTAFFAVKHAVVAAREDQGRRDWPQFEAPATVGRVQQAIGPSAEALRLG